MCWVFFFFQAEDGIRDLVRSRGLGDVYKRQGLMRVVLLRFLASVVFLSFAAPASAQWYGALYMGCLLYTSDAADERSSVDLGGRRIIKKKNRTRIVDITRTSIKQRRETTTEASDVK